MWLGSSPPSQVCGVLQGGESCFLGPDGAEYLGTGSSMLGGMEQRWSRSAHPPLTASRGAAGAPAWPHAARSSATLVPCVPQTFDSAPGPLWHGAGRCWRARGAGCRRARPVPAARRVESRSAHRGRAPACPACAGGWRLAPRSLSPFAGSWGNKMLCSASSSTADASPCPLSCRKSPQRVLASTQRGLGSPSCTEVPPGQAICYHGEG